MLSKNTVSAPMVFFSELGGLHDALITAFLWHKEDRVFRMDIDDLNSSFLDLPEYRGLRPVGIVFSGVQYLDCNVQIRDSDFRIFDFLVEEESCFSVNIKCSPGGYFKCQCESIELIDI